MAAGSVLLEVSMRAEGGEVAWLPVSCGMTHSVYCTLVSWKHHIPPKDFSIKGRIVPGSPPATLSLCHKLPLHRFFVRRLVMAIPCLSRV